jgi:hypothetical protein
LLDEISGSHGFEYEDDCILAAAPSSTEGVNRRIMQGDKERGTNNVCHVGQVPSEYTEQLPRKHTGRCEKLKSHVITLSAFLVAVGRGDTPRMPSKMSRMFEKI